MAQTLEIPSTFGWSDQDIDAIINHMVRQESGGNPNAVGKKGEVGLVQIMPKTAAQYGVSAEMLKNPVVNRYVARRYLTDLLSKYKGNMNEALEAYNAGPGRIDKSLAGEATVPKSTLAYVKNAMRFQGGPASPGATPQTQAPVAQQGILERLGIEGTANADEGVPIDKLSSEDRAAIAKIKSGAATPPAKPEPFGARAASWLPTIGQGVGDFAGATGGALIPGLGETGLPEYAGAVAGGTMGSAGGAALENKIRAAYGLPPVSVGGEAAKGALASTVGGALPGILRLRKAAAIMRSTGRGFEEALQSVLRSDAALESTLGTGARKAEMLSQAPSNPVERAYRTTRNAELTDIRKAMDDLYRPFGFKRTPNNVANVLNGAAGKKLELAGRSLRQALEDEINAQPMTVTRARVILSNLRANMRQMNPDQNGVALGAYRDIEKALEDDIDAVIGAGNVPRRKVLDQMYARKLDEFPLKPIWRAMTEPQVADEILDGKANVAVIEQMKARGNIEALRRGVAVRLFKTVRDKGAKNPAELLKALQKAVSNIEPEVFDALYGKGARADWLRTASDITAKQSELLKSPTKAAAIGKAVQDFLEKPGNLARAQRYLASHTIPIEVVMLAAGGYVGGPRGLAEMGVAVFGLWAYESLASPVARGLLRAASRTADPQATARLFVAAISASIRAEGEHVLAPTGTGGP